MQEQEEQEEQQERLQPVVLVTPKRVECGTCRALAVFVMMDVAKEEGDDILFNYVAYCQDCWHTYVVEHQEEDEEGD